MVAFVADLYRFDSCVDKVAQQCLLYGCALTFPWPRTTRESIRRFVDTPSTWFRMRSLVENARKERETRTKGDPREQWAIERPLFTKGIAWRARNAEFVYYAFCVHLAHEPLVDCARALERRTQGRTNCGQKKIQTSALCNWRTKETWIMRCSRGSTMCLVKEWCTRNAHERPRKGAAPVERLLYPPDFIYVIVRASIRASRKSDERLCSLRIAR